MPRYTGRGPDGESGESRQNGEHNEEQGRSWVGNPNPHRQGRMSDETRYQPRPNVHAGEHEVSQYRSSDRTKDQMTQGRTTGGQSDTRSNQGYDRYGMDNEDWRHLDDYWRAMYGDSYPHEKEWNRGGRMGIYAGRGPRNYKRSDERIQEDLHEQLTRHSMIDATDIEISVHNGEVVLRGTVDRREMKRMAEDVAEAVSGVKDVRNEIKVRKAEWREGERAA